MPPDVNEVAEPSAAAAEKPFSLSDLTPEQRQEWRRTTNLPKDDKPAESSAASAADKSDQPKPQQGKKKNAAERTAEIEADVQKLEAALHRKAELKRQLAEESGDK